MLLTDFLARLILVFDHELVVHTLRPVRYT